jgi:branched-chain amino acid transport system permease protein
MPDLGPFVVAGVSLGSVYALSGVGIVMLHRATGTLNLAHGALGALSALVAWELTEERGWPVLAASAVGLVATVALAAVYGRVVARRLTGREPMVQASATLGLMLVLLGACNWYWGDRPRRLRLPSDRWGFSILDTRVTGTRLVALMLALGVTAGITMFLSRTRMGLRMRALADDRSVSSIIGVPVDRTTTTAWLIAGALAATTGVLLGNLSRLDPPTLTFLVIPGLAAAVCGRLTSLGATLAAGIAMGAAEALATPYGSVSSYRSAAPYLIGLLVVFWSARSPYRLAR